MPTPTDRAALPRPRALLRALLVKLSISAFPVASSGGWRRRAGEDEEGGWRAVKSDYDGTDAFEAY